MQSQNESTRAESYLLSRESRVQECACLRAPALWYQAEQHGFVDLNFASFVPQIVRFRPGTPPLGPLALEHDPGGFEWKKDNGRQYRYFFVHKVGPSPANFFANSECDVALVTQEGEWSLYEQRSCR